MEHYTNDELIEFIRLDAPILKDKNINRSKKSLAIIGQLIMLSGLDENKKNGYVYRTNEELANDVETDESTLRRLTTRLEEGNYIVRKAGSRANNKASEYILNWKMISDIIPDYAMKTPTPKDVSATPEVPPQTMRSATPEMMAELTNAIKVLTLEIRSLHETLEELKVKTPTPKVPPSETDIDIDIEKDIDIETDIYNKNNIIENNNKNILREESYEVGDDGFDFYINFNYVLSKVETSEELQKLKRQIDQERRRMNPNPNGQYTLLLEQLIKEKEEELAVPTEKGTFNLDRMLQRKEEEEDARLARQVASQSMLSATIDDLPF